MSNRTEHFDRQRKNMRGGQIIISSAIIVGLGVRNIALYIQDH